MDNAQRCKERYYFYKLKGICVRCGRDRAMINSTECPECAEKRAIKDSKRKFKEGYREYDADNHKNQRLRRLEQGLCTRCGKSKKNSDFKMCEYCRAKRRKIYLDKTLNSKMTRTEAKVYFNLCRICGSEDVLKDKKLCKKCYERVCENLKIARSKINKENHIFRKLSEIDCKRGKQKNETRQEASKIT